VRYWYCSVLKIARPEDKEELEGDDKEQLHGQGQEGFQGKK
jgi:hypothetical protein